jgi:hypothetical protein
VIQLNGVLGAVGLIELLQLLGNVKETGQLELVGAGHRAVFDFDEGTLVDASFDGQRGLGAVAACNALTADAIFTFARGSTPIGAGMRYSPGELKAYLTSESVAAVESPPPATVRKRLSPLPLLVGAGLLAASVAVVTAVVSSPPASENVIPVSLSSLPRYAAETPAVPPAQPTPESMSPTEAPSPTLTPKTPGRHGFSLDLAFADTPPTGWFGSKPYAYWDSGAYRMFARDAARFVAVGAPVGNDLADVVVSARLHKTGGPDGGGYGLIVRSESGAPLDGLNQTFAGYVLEVGDRGEFGIWRRSDDHWIDLVPWTPSEAVHQATDANELVASATGKQLRLTVNGVQVAQVEDATLGVGGVGVMIGGDGNEAQLDHFAVETPE